MAGKIKVLTSNTHWCAHLSQMKNWSSWLAIADEPEKLAIIRRNIEKGLPCGAVSPCLKNWKRRLTAYSNTNLRADPGKMKLKGSVPFFALIADSTFSFVAMEFLSG